MYAIKLKARIGADSAIEWLNIPPDLPPGEVEVLVLYVKPQEHITSVGSPDTWPVLDGGFYLGGSLGREDIYDDDGR